MGGTDNCCYTPQSDDIMWRDIVEQKTHLCGFFPSLKLVLQNPTEGLMILLWLTGMGKGEREKMWALLRPWHRYRSRVTHKVGFNHTECGKARQVID